jgi:ethanolamine kinase
VFPPFRDNPDLVLPRTVDPAASERDQALLDVVRRIVPTWSDARHARISVVHGGITNQLFLLRSGALEPLLVRVYGANTHVVIDREAENALFAALSRQDFAPTFHGRFENGRVEGWLEGYLALEPQELGQPALRRLIARQLSVLHALPATTPHSCLWQTLEGWMAAACSVELSGEHGRMRDGLGLERAAEVLARLRRHEEQVLRPAARSWGGRRALRSVCAHNDLLAGNILVNGQRDQVRFIDYEYGASAPAAFDVANHFCEYAGFDSDYVNGFPSREGRDDFVAAYLGPSASLADISDFSRIVEFYVLPDHLWWGTWAIIQAAHSAIEFDYLGYAQLRLAGLDLHLSELGFDLG